MVNEIFDILPLQTQLDLMQDPFLQYWSFKAFYWWFYCYNFIGKILI